MDDVIEGGCLCGKTRHRLRELPVRISNCHCIDCRRGSGAAVVTWGVVRSNEVEMLTGQLRKVRHAERLRSFAACCGTPLFFQDGEASATIDVTIASLDYPEPYAPKKFVALKQRDQHSGRVRYTVALASSSTSAPGSSGLRLNCRS